MLSITTTRLFWLRLSQSLATKVDPFSWPQLERSLKIWLGEADLLWRGLSMLLEVWKVQGLILVKWPAIFFRQLCYTKPVRPTVGRGGERGSSAWKRQQRHHFPPVSRSWWCSFNAAGGHFWQELWQMHSKFKELWMIPLRKPRAINLLLSLLVCPSAHFIWTHYHGMWEFVRSQIIWGTVFWSWKPWQKVKNSARASTFLWNKHLRKIFMS